MDFNDMKALVFEIKNLHDKVEIYSKSNDYVYTDVYKTWIKEYNDLLDNYIAFTSLRLTHMSYNIHDLSSTQKTVRNATVKFFLNTLSSLIGKIESDIKTNRLKMAEKRLHHTKCVNVSK